MYSLSTKIFGEIDFKWLIILENLGYVKAADVQTAEGRTKAVIYELKGKAYLALMLDSIGLESLLNRTNEESATKILAVIAELI